EQSQVRWSGRYQRLLDHPKEVAAAALPGESFCDLNPGDVMSGLFNWVGGPIDFEHLVGIVAELWGVRDYPAQENVSPEDGHDELEAEIADTRADVAGEVENRDLLIQLW